MLLRGIAQKLVYGIEGGDSLMRWVGGDNHESGKYKKCTDAVKKRPQSKVGLCNFHPITLHSPDRQNYCVGLYLGKIKGQVKRDTINIILLPPHPTSTMSPRLRKENKWASEFFDSFSRVIF